MESIRESGDIEQDAHNMVILSRDYAEVVKAREGCESSHKKSINAVKQFVFWETSGEYEEGKKDNDNADGEKRGTVKKKVLIKHPRYLFGKANSESKETL
jgi:replicative DNA helicase